MRRSVFVLPLIMQRDVLVTRHAHTHTSTHTHTHAANTNRPLPFKHTNTPSSLAHTYTHTRTRTRTRTNDTHTPHPRTHRQAISADTEGNIYVAARKLGITLFTISHRPKLQEYHEYQLRLDGHGGWDLLTRDEVMASGSFE